MRGQSAAHLKTIRQIFFESSSRTEFRDEAEKERFFQRWTEYYLSEHPDRVYLALNDQNQPIGYLMGCPDSRQGQENTLFKDLFDQFPAHLHINLTEAARGQGIGVKLIEAFLADLNACPGVHIVTSPHARNRSFYWKMGFHHVIEREQNGKKFLFMGRTL